MRRLRSPWRRPLRTEHLKTVTEAMDDANHRILLHIRRVKEELSAEIAAARPVPHFTPAPLELPLEFVQLFRQNATWQFDLSPLLVEPGQRTLVVERHGSSLFLIFKDHYGSRSTVFSLVGVDG